MCGLCMFLHVCMREIHQLQCLQIQGAKKFSPTSTKQVEIIRKRQAGQFSPGIIHACNIYQSCMSLTLRRICSYLLVFQGVFCVPDYLACVGELFLSRSYLERPIFQLCCNMQTYN